MRERATRRGVTLEKQLDPAIGNFAADERKLKQILINLMTNAVKFTEEGGSVVLRARCSERGLKVSVRDTGIGIAPDDLARIFH